MKKQKESNLPKRDKPYVKANTHNEFFDLTDAEHSLLMWVANQVRRGDDSSAEEYAIDVADFCRSIGLDHSSDKHYDSIKAVIKAFADKSTWIMLPDGDTETLLRWIKRPYFFKDSGIIKITLDDYIKPYILQMQDRKINAIEMAANNADIKIKQDHTTGVVCNER